MWAVGNTKYGNIQLDHFSRAAADALTGYWDENLIPYYGDAWKSVRSLFIDSLEFETQADWTYGIQDAFLSRFGYDVTPYLPAIYDEGGNWEDGNWGATGNYMGEPMPEFSFDKNSSQVLNDWRELLTELYETNHVKPIAEWAQKNGVTLRYQTSYGKDMETAQSALYPDIPETESLFGNDHMDFYRLQAGYGYDFVAPTTLALDNVVVDQASGDADVSELVQPGENTIEVTVASSLLNAILENNKDIKNDEGRVLDDRNPSAYGLTDVVTIDGSATRA